MTMMEHMGHMMGGSMYVWIGVGILLIVLLVIVIIKLTKK